MPKLPTPKFLTKKEPAEAPDPTKMPGYYEGETVTRRKFFERSAGAVGGIASAAVGLPAIGFAVAPIFKRPPAVFQPIGKLDDFSFDTYVERIITQVPGIGVIGKTTVYVRRRDPDTDPQNDLSPEIVAISTRCTHLGCSARYFDAAKTFVCPCHTSAFDFQGKRITGPAPRPLDQFNTRVKDGVVLLGPRFSVTDKLKPVAPRDPSNHVEGLWKYVYPPRFDTPPWKG